MGRRRQAKRERRQEEKQTFGRGGNATRYKMRQKIFALGQDFYIEDQNGRKVFKVDGKVLRVRDTLKFKDLQGHTLCQIQQKVARIKDTMDIDGPDGKRMAAVKKAIITPVRDRSWSLPCPFPIDVMCQSMHSGPGRPRTDRARLRSRRCGQSR